MREPDTLAFGNLPSLGRKVLESRLVRLEPALRLRERVLNPAPLVDSAADRLRNDAQRRGLPSETQAARSKQLLLPDTPVESQPAPPPQDAGRDGVQLRQVQIELRALRAEIYQLSRAMGTPSRESNRTEFRGILQQPDELESNVRLRRWRKHDAQRQDAINAALRRNESARISQRQQELLRALQRAERRLAEAPRNLPPGLRDGIVGEIYRARFSIALFGGVNGTGQLVGMEYDDSI